MDSLADTIASLGPPHNLDSPQEHARSLPSSPRDRVDVVFVTNTVREEEPAPLRRLCDEILTARTWSVRSYGNLRRPFHTLDIS